MRLSHILFAGMLSACSGSSASSTSRSPLAAPSNAAGSAPGATSVRPAPNGIAFPVGYQEWATIAVSHRTDNGTLRVILGNDAAIAAVRSGATSPWPDGVALGKVVWKETHLDLWDQAIVPEALVHAEFYARRPAELTHEADHTSSVFCLNTPAGYEELCSTLEPGGLVAVMDRGCFPFFPEIGPVSLANLLDLEAGWAHGLPGQTIVIAAVPVADGDVPDAWTQEEVPLR